jgi:hypothetical protein
MDKIEAKLIAADDERITLEWQSRGKESWQGKETVNNKNYLR